MKKIKVRLGRWSYPILIGSRILSRGGYILRRMEIGKDAVIITNSRIWALYGRRLKRTLQNSDFSVSCEKIPDKESSKSGKEVLKLVEKLSYIDKRRGTFIAAFGGGVVGDLAGFVACIYKRGIPYVQIPTTLLGQVDSAIGGKVAIDLDAAKNLVGAFYQPKLVLSDTSLLLSLPMREIKSGLAEIIKYGVIADKRLFLFVEKNLKKLLERDSSSLEYVIHRCSRIKANIVERDEKDERGIRAILNYGHTIGHAIEAAAGFSKLYTHGEAVAIGMAAASDIAFEIGLLKKNDKTRIESLIKNAGLPTKIHRLRLNDIMEAQSYDKKIIHGVNRFVVPTGIGNARICEDIPKRIIRDIIKRRTAHGNKDL